MLFGESTSGAHLLEHASAADLCTSRIKLSAMLLRFGSFRFCNITPSVKQQS
jgi:hypothetical protein